jgi:hypothetical protein
MHRTALPPEITVTMKNRPRLTTRTARPPVRRSAARLAADAPPAFNTGAEDSPCKEATMPAAARTGAAGPATAGTARRLAHAASPNNAAIVFLKAVIS